MTWDHRNRTTSALGPSGARAAGVVDVACDESGSDGENLVAGNTPVFAHAGVRMPVDVAEGYVREIRDRIRSPAEEYKANHLLREKHRPVLEWLLSRAGPLDGHARVHLVEKAFLVVDRVAGLLLDDPAAAVTLFRAGRPAVGDAAWREFLTAANRLLRVRSDGAPGAPAPVDGFLRAVDRLARERPGGGAGEVLERLGGARERALAYREEVRDRPYVVAPLLDPLLPSVVATAAHWSAGGRSVRLTHDRQNMLTPERIGWIEERARRRGIALVEFRLVRARDDARVQLADFLAGTAQRIASDELAGHGDPVLGGLLRTFTGADAVWGDEESWARLGPEAGRGTAGAAHNSAAGEAR
ncbi:MULTISPECIES: hypothetical protein [unclassified Streptomyces]|uniref:hypothetical protein n=1 Tax=unclassified Streptomyces TaxID=2593676 RepID=UPI0037FA2339